MEDEIRVNDAHIQKFLSDIKKPNVTEIVQKIFRKIKVEIVKMFSSYPVSSFSSMEEIRESECINKAIYYDYNFQVAMSKHFLPENKKYFVTDMFKTILKTVETLIINVS